MSLNKVIAAIVILLLLIGGVYFFTYNGLVSAQEEVYKRWYDVEIQYQRRADLIPDLVNTVKGYAAHEEKIFTDVTKYQSQWNVASTQEEKMKAVKGWDSAILNLSSELNVVVVNYPQLRSNDTFLALQAQLEGTVNRIAKARRDYNEAVREYNTQLKRIPSSFVAGMSGFEPKSYFEAEKGAQDAPEVNFNQPGTTNSPSATPSTIANASVKLYGVKTDVEVGENIVLKLSAVNLITKPIMTAQIILIPPSGMAVTSSDFVVSGAGQYSTTYKLEPGGVKDIEIMIQTVQTGDFVVEGRVIYYFGTDLSTQEDHTLKLPVKVRSKKPIT